MDVAAPHLGSDGSVHHELLLELASHLSGSLDVGEVLTRALDATRRVIDFRGGSIALVEGDYLSIAVSDPAVGPEVAALRLPIGEGISGRVAATGESMYSPDLKSDPRVTRSVLSLDTNAPMRSYFAVPVVASGKVVGVLQIDSEEPDAFGETERAMVTSLAPLMGAAIQNARVFTQELETEDELKELAQLRSDFIAISSHELRTPLTPMIGFAELLASGSDQIPGNMPVAEVIDRLIFSAERLKAHVAGLQRLASVDIGWMVMKHERVDPIEVVERAIASINRPVRVLVETSGHAMADPDRIEDALRCLLDNALSFSPEGSSIDVRVTESGNEIQIAVLDEGPGVPEEDANRIFERFAQRESPHTREVGGLGIGLSLARGLVEKMNGSLIVIPGPRGHFVIALPASP